MPNDWSLSYPGVDVPFGSVASGYVFNKAPEIGAPSAVVDDQGRPRADGVAFGLDYLGGRTVAFDLTVNGTDEDDARALLATLARAWRADVVRSTPGAVATLTASSGRVTFGRPRRFASNDDLLPSGMSKVLVDFACADSVWYGPEQSADVALVPEPGGGLLAPLASPLSTTATSDRSRAFTVTSDLPTWPVFEIHGPITNPVVEVVGLLRMEFRLSLAFDQTLVVDTRPWARSTLLDGASKAGSLTRTSTRLSQAAIPAGEHELVLRGDSDSGTASASIRWRDAYPTP
ncbi:minor tail protein [Arthrobacter phage SWEP2]|uniref:Minor tail protein n=1 Tax=Arthrobacter phage SWEP2 TaxID=2945958 RepID=A0A9E7SI14_9CAUD|nr:minor tail protein [Arthrobacter phage SWEP2]